MFIIYHFSFGYTVPEAGILCAVLTVLFCTGMAFSSFFRCIIALVVPNFFTGIGRTIMLSAIFALMLNYPVSNISQNARETGTSMACIVELAANQTRVLQRELAIPIRDMSEYVQDQQKELKATTEEMHAAFARVKSVLDKFDKGAATADEALDFVKEVRTMNVLLNYKLTVSNRDTRLSILIAFNLPY